jgi:hypothetical protein
MAIGLPKEINQPKNPLRGGGRARTCGSAGYGCFHKVYIRVSYLYDSGSADKTEASLPSV